MQNQRVLVTGGGGFVGSNLANHLNEENEVIVIDDCSLGTATYLDEEIAFFERSVLESDLPTDVDVVFHLAAKSSYPMHETDPMEGSRVNVEGFVNIVEQARADGCETFVYASTSSVYGDRTEPTPESVEVMARTGYEASKLARERYAEYFNHHYGLELAGMRLFSVYQGYGGAESHKGQYANLVSQFADDIANGDSPIIYGDGTQTRDFTHVSDVVSALVTAAEHQLHGIYNVGTGESYSLNELVEQLNSLFDRSIDPEYIENPIPESVYVHDTCADSSKLSSKTGWEPAIDFETGLQRVRSQYE